MSDKCPGVSNIKNPTLEIKICPQCGEEIEIFSDEMKAACPRCKFEIFNDIVSCISWCKYARECVGEEMYNKYTKNLNSLKFLRISRRDITSPLSCLNG